MLAGSYMLTEAVDDVLRGETSHHAFASAYKHATFEMIDDAGHYSMVETPVRVAGIVERQVTAAN